MQRGDIVLTPFPFTSLESKKVRPALIISSPLIDDRTVIVAFISSVINKENILKVDFLLDKTDKNFDKTGLKKTSIFKLGKLATLDKKIIYGRIGHLPEELMNKINEKLKKALLLE